MLEGHISQYRIIRRIGQGNMGEVYEAEDTIVGNVVAIKAIQPNRRDLHEAIQRFRNEAKAISEIDHNNVVRLQHMVQEGDDYYMVMQFVDGESVRECIGDNGMPVEQALRIACDAASGLIAAHKRGIVHRDLKPDNIMVTTDGVTKVLDFGVAHFVDLTTITQDGAFIGTMSYAAPEQLDHTSREIDQRVDVYALGVVLFEMLTGHRPFEPRDQRALPYQIVHMDAPPLSRYRSDLPDGLERVVDRAISKDRDDRYADMTEMLHDLELIRKRVYGADTDVDEDRLIAGWRLSKRAKRLVTAAVLAVVVVGAAWFVVDQFVAPREKPRIMVARMESAGAAADLNWVSGAMMSGLIRTLGDLDGHNVISRQTVAAAMQTLQPVTAAGSPISYGAAQGVGASYLVSGTLLRAGPWVRFDCELTDMSNDGVLVDSWTVEVRDSTQLDAAVIELALGISDALDANWQQDPRDSDSPLPTASTVALRYYEQALAAEERDDIPVAIDNARKAAAADTTFTEAHYLMASLTPDMAEEQKHMAYAMKYRLQSPPIVRKLVEAQNFLFADDIVPATAMYEEVLAEDPEQVQARKDLAFLYRRQRRFTEAASEYVVLHRISPLDRSFYRAWALSYGEIGRPDKAFELIENWRNDMPDDEAPHRELLFIYNGFGAYLQGAALCDSIANTKPESMPFACGWLYGAVGRLDDAEQIYLALVQSPDARMPSSRGSAYLAYLSYRRQQYDRGLEYAEKALEHQDVEYYRWLAGLLAAGAGRTDIAREHADAIAIAISLEPGDTVVADAIGPRRFYYHLRGMIELADGNSAEALTWLEQTLDHTTRFEDPYWRTFVASAHLDDGNPDEATRHLEVALELRPGYPEAMLYLGKAHLMNENFGQAESVFEDLQELRREADSDDPLTVELNRLMATTSER